MTTINGVVTQMKRAVRAADLNGNGTLATQEIREAQKKGLVTKAEAALLNRTASDAGNSRGGLTVTNYDRWLDRYGDAATRADASHDKHLSGGEVKAAPDAIRTTDGTSIWATRSMLTKFEKVASDPAKNSQAPLTDAEIDQLVEKQNAFEQVFTP